MFEQISDSFIAGILKKKKQNRPTDPPKNLAERATQTFSFWP